MADSHPGDAVVLDELCLRGKLLAFAQMSALNAIAKLIGDLPEDRPVAVPAAQGDAAPGIP